MYFWGGLYLYGEWRSCKLAFDPTECPFFWAAPQWAHFLVVLPSDQELLQNYSTKGPHGCQPIIIGSLRRTNQTFSGQSGSFS